MTGTQHTVDKSSPDARWWWTLAAIVAVAAWVRLCNLGSFSLALDEVFTMGRAVLPLGDLITAGANDPENMPLYLFITKLSLWLGLTDPWIRLFPVAAGLASIVIWALWTRAHFGPSVGLLLGGMLAISTFHIRYSQELRAYPYLLLITGATMIVGDLIRQRPTLVHTAILSILVGLGCFSHHSFLLIFIPLIGIVIFDRDAMPETETASPIAVRRSLIGGLVLGMIPYLGWLAHIATRLQHRVSRGATHWTLELVEERWQFLTVAANEGEPLGWLAVVLAVLGVIGVTIALRDPAGRVTLLPAVAGIFLMEGTLVALNRWSKGRYETTLWPFVMILVALGVYRMLLRLGPKALRFLVIAILAVAMLFAVDAYHRTGRPHWDRMAEAVRVARRPGEPVLAENHWSTECVEHYYAPGVTTLGRDPAALRAELHSVPSALVVAPLRNRPPDLRKLTRRGSLIATIPDTGWLYRLRPDLIGPAGPPESLVWPQPAAELPPGDLERPVDGCWPVIGHAGETPERTTDRLIIDFEPSSRSGLRSGWSDPKPHPSGGSFSWVVSREATVEIRRSETSAADLVIDLWPVRSLVDSQRIRVIVNGHILGDAPLQPGWQRLAFRAQESSWLHGPNLVVLQFWTMADALLGLGDVREIPERAAGVQRIEVHPRSTKGHSPASSLIVGPPG